MAAQWREGLRVAQTNPPAMAVTVAPGVIEADGARIEVAGAERLPLAPPPVLRMRGHYYTLEREGDKSPCGWDMSGRRGSDFKPYQMRVPGTLRVRSEDGQTVYAADEDYVYDDYYGSVKAKPGGRLRVGDTVLLDYDTYTCRYHTVYAGADGIIGVAEGDWRYGDETNLLLPDPPAAPEGAVPLASVFVPWGATAVYERSCFAEIEGGSPAPGRFVWDSRHIDWRPRVYEVSAAGEGVVIATDLCAYGNEPGRELTQPIEENGEADLPVARADGTPVYWGVRFPWRAWRAAHPQADRVRVHTQPANIMDIRRGESTLACAMRQVETAENGADFPAWLASIAGKKELQLCFLGESTTYGGDWPLLIVQGMQRLLPANKVFWSNPSVGGYASDRGLSSVKKNRTFGHTYDIVFVEYLINDTSCGNEHIHDAMTGIVRWVRGRDPHALVVIIAASGGNPMLGPHYNPEQFERVYRVHRAVAEEQGAMFIGVYPYFRRLDEAGVYFLTVLKENMLNHPYSSTAINGTWWDEIMAEAFLRWIRGKLADGANSNKFDMGTIGRNLA